MSASKKMSRRFVRGAVLPAAIAWMGLVGASVGLMQGVCIPTPPEGPPIDVTATASATTVTPNTQVTITATVANATGTVTYAWSVAGVGGLAGSLSGSQVTFLSGTTGTAIVTVTAADSGTGTSDTTTVTITVAAVVPTCSLVVTASGAAVVLPATGTLSATITTAGTPPYTFSWLQTAGDPATVANGTGQNTAVTFPAAGDYTFSVTVTDAAACTANDDVTVTVTGTSVTVDTTFTLNIDNLTGSTGDDVFDAAQVWDFGALNNTLQTGDRAEGNGGNDALNASLDFSLVAANIRPNLTNIQTINVAESAAGFALQLDNSSGITAVNSDNSLALVDFNALQSLPTTIGLFNTNTGLTLSAIAAAATAGGSDSTTLQLSGARLAGGLEPTAVVTLNTGAASGIETLTIDSGGSSANEIDSLATTGNTTSMTTLNVTGSQALEIMDWSGGTTLPNSIVTVNASGMTGGGAALRLGTGAVTFTGSGFADVIYDGANYTTADVINGGEGNDTLAVTTALADVGATQANVTSIEAITITNAHTTAPVLTRFGTITQVNLEAGFTAGTVTLPTGGNVVIGKKHTANVAGAGAGTITLSGGSPGTATLTLADADPAGLITVTNTSTLNVVSSGNLNGNAAGGTLNAITGGITQTAAGAKSMSLTGDTPVTLATVTGPTTINAGTFGQAVTITLGNGAAYTGGTAVDTVTGSASDDTISGGTGNDVILGLAGADSIDGGAGDDQITGGLGDDAVTGGAGADQFTFTDTTDDSLYTGGADVVSDFTSADDLINLDKSAFGLNDAAGALAAGSYYEGAAGGMTAGTAYQVIVLTSVDYANVGAAEDAVAAASTSASEGVIIFFDSTSIVARMFYDPDIGADGGLTNADTMATFSNITALANLAAAFDVTDFTIVP